MPQDPFYEQILAGLNGSLDPQVFEDCVADLLREQFPTLVPVRGGKDSGMDGAVADGEGEPFPLVVTTAQDVRRNLRKSLDSFVKRGQPARKVVFATSRVLTPQRRLNLMDLARGKGFTLVQIIEQRGVANLLMKSPRWYKQLLGLSGQPSALSVVPRSRRPLLDLEPIGRAGDLEWLQQTAGDRMVSGEPGSGKTFLLYHLVRQGWGLFLVEPGGDIAGALREQQPRIVVVDDAHTEPETLEKLRHFRQQAGMDFSIVAVTWEGARNEVVEAMGGLPEEKVRKLELLTRSEILEVFRSAGVEENADIMRYLIDQAANKPGLAVTIATLWLAGSWREVIEGKVLSRTLLAFFQEFVYPKSTDVLAAFSLGGDRGMGMDAVGDFLGISRLELRHVAAGLAAGGVLSEVDKETLAVWPRPLRFSMIRTVFFPPPGQPRHPYQELIKKAPSLGRAVEALIAAKSLGAEIPAQELRHLAADLGSLRVWNGLAQLSEQDARWVFENYPGDVLDIGFGLLNSIPRLAIPKILERAAEFAAAKDRSGQPMSLLSSWVQQISVRQEEWIRRRVLIADAVREFLVQGGDLGVGMHGLSIALSPGVRGSDLDPGLGSTVTLRSGLLPVRTLREILPIWDRLKDSIHGLDRESWQHLSSLLWKWLHPEYVAKRTEISEEERQVTREFVGRALADLSPLAAESPGLRAGLSRLAKELDVDLGWAEDEVFEILYPPDEPSYELYKEKQAARKEAVQELAAAWANEPPYEIAERITFFEREASRISYSGLENMTHLCRRLAESVRNPEVWLTQLLQRDLRGNLVSPFLEQIVKLRRAGWDRWLLYCLERDFLFWTAASEILSLSNPPRQLLDRALLRVRDHPVIVESLSLRREIPIPTLKEILLCSDWEISLAAAVGEWCCDPQGQVRAEVQEEWRTAVIRSKTGEYEETEQRVGLQYWLRGILASDADLAFDWLRCRLRDSDLPGSFMGDSPFAAAIRALREKQRRKLLIGLQPAPILWSLLPMLIGSDIDLYRELLNNDAFADYHLLPLGGLPGPIWESFALAALDAGYAPEAIAQRTFGTSHSLAGSSLEYWEGWDRAFAAFEKHPREDLREAVCHGRAWVQEEIGKAQKRQKRFDLHGLGRDE
ncbi:MAG: hypothetical protein ACJ75H_19925 [Thermoanaerobaculia bacterium]